MWQLTRPADVVVMQVGEHDRPDRIRLNAARTRLRNDVLTTSDPGDSTRQHLPTAASPGGWTRREFPHCSVLREAVYVLDRMTDVVSLAEAAGRDVARVLTNAFVDDPGWRDVGPNRARHRRLALWAYHRALQRKAQRWGRPGYAAFRGGQLVGVAVTFASEAWPPPEPASTLLDVPAFALAGPPAALRGWRASAIIERAHFRDPHMFLWQLAVDPPVQRSGIGHKLMERVLADADAAELAVYLETAEVANVPYYRSFGFVETGRETLPRGAPLWLMLRPSA